MQYSPCSLDHAAATVRRFSMKALTRYQVILLGEQRHIRCEQLAQGCCPNNAAAGVEPATSRSRVLDALPLHLPSHSDHYLITIRDDQLGTVAVLLVYVSKLCGLIFINK